MLQRKHAGIAVMTLLLSSSVAYAGGSGFPSSAPELATGPASSALQRSVIKSGSSHTEVSVFPSSASEAGEGLAYRGSERLRAPMTGIAQPGDSVFPSSSNETGPVL
ncbi:MAG: hypothetical protein HY526_08770 [Betaproteobacteria bacterium]|nr:hypothetical protein [Betaproteobacteria bacterium]